MAFHAADAGVLTGTADAGAPTGPAEGGDARGGVSGGVGGPGASASTTGACADCHREEGDRAHPEIRVTRCALCHPSTRDWKVTAFRHEDAAATACTECHRLPDDRLHGELSLAARGDCAACHGTERWKPAELSHASLAEDGRGRCDRCHADDGRRAHPGLASTRCQSCHVSTRNWSSVNFVHAEVAGQSCAGCHRAPRNMIHAGTAGTSCSRCHTTRAWEPSTFRHPRVPEFGEHLEHVGCRGCHPSSLNRAVLCERCHGRGGFFEED